MGSGTGYQNSTVDFSTEPFDNMRTSRLAIPLKKTGIEEIKTVTSPTSATARGLRSSPSPGAYNSHVREGGGGED